MIKLGDYDVDRFVKYTISQQPLYDTENSFLGYDGKQNKPIAAWKYNIALSSEAVETSIAATILSAIQSNTFNVTFDTPQGTITKEFRCPNKPCDLQFNLANVKRYWKIDLTFEEV